MLRLILTAGVRDALPFGTVWEASSDGEMFGVALWLPPRRFPLTAGRKLRGAPTIFRLLVSALPSYLETARPDSVSFYARLGFRVEREGVRLLPEGPTHWTMRRPPPTA